MMHGFIVGEASLEVRGNMRAVYHVERDPALIKVSLERTNGTDVRADGVSRVAVSG
jgi:hypothetical protein